MAVHRGRPAPGLLLLLVAGILVSCSPRRGVAPSDPGAGTAPEDTLALQPAVPIQVQLDDEDRAALTAQLERDLAFSRNVLATRPDPAGLPAEERERWETLGQYLELTTDSRSAGDLRAAADLAQKARLLAERLRQD